MQNSLRVCSYKIGYDGFWAFVFIKNYLKNKRVEGMMAQQIGKGIFMKKLTMILSLVLLMGCSGAQEQNKVVSEKGDPVQKQVEQELEKKTSPFDGTYVFDMEKYKTEQLKQEDSMFKKMKPIDVDRMMRIFRPFKIQVEGDQAKASFSHDVITGKLIHLSRDNGLMKYNMIPNEEDKRDQTVTLIFDGSNLVLKCGTYQSDFF